MISGAHRNGRSGPAPCAGPDCWKGVGALDPERKDTGSRFPPRRQPDPPSADGTAHEPAPGEAVGELASQRLPDGPETGEDAGPGASGDGGAESGAQVALQPELEEELARARAELEKLSAQMLRLQADFDNHRRRARQESERAAEEAVERLVRRLLPVVDGLERAIRTMPDPMPADEGHWSGLATGIRMVHQELLRALEAEGIHRIAAERERFDPAVHQVVDRVTVPQAEDDQRVVAELQAGYLLRGRVLRPSLVRVGVWEGAQGSEAARQNPAASGQPGEGSGPAAQGREAEPDPPAGLG